MPAIRRYRHPVGRGAALYTQLSPRIILYISIK
jgi:hypothetical protein